ncbi:MAG: hypothetical protein IGS39_12180 [Calothrix sp. C42_A2020_038]|nr:hypothetical protein [Calothrix sp. C42_A2020_038]
MASETKFLQPIASNHNSIPNFAQAQGSAIFFNYSQKPSGLLTTAQTEVLVKGGVAAAIAEALAIAEFKKDPNFTALFTESIGVGLDGSYAGIANSETKVVDNFAVGKNQSFSFDFATDLALKVKEIENPNAEYNHAKAKTAFLVIDTTDLNKPKIVDYFGIQGQLVSSRQNGNFKIKGKRDVTITSREETTDIDGDNGVDFLTDKTTGTYKQTFKRDTNLTIVETNASTIAFAGDTLIGNLGKDVIYGTIKNDKLIGTNGADKIYGSQGDDRLEGKKGDDILEGGQGNDELDGGEGNDKLYGGWGNDILIGGRGNDILAGGEGYDQFVFKRGDGLLKGESDIILDFQVGIDKLVFKNWGNINPQQWLNEMFSLGNITNTNDGVLFKFDGGRNEGTLLLTGINSNQINSQSIIFD